MDSSLGASREKRRRRLERVTAACDLCKTRKVKCDGRRPCAYCTSKNRSDSCSFSAPRIRPTSARSAATNSTPAESNVRTAADQTPPPPGRDVAPSEVGSRTTHNQNAAGQRHSLSPTVSRDGHHDDTAVPLEARLLRDAQGKVIFIGDCAPLSFLQTVRHLIASEVDPDGFPMQVSRDSVIEVTQSSSCQAYSEEDLSLLGTDELVTIVSSYLVATSGLVDLFDRNQLFADVKSWANGVISAEDTAFAVYYVLAAIGIQERDERKAEQWFTRARDLLRANLGSNMNLATVRGFALIAIYMLRAFQPNGAYLYFSLAARTAYAIGLHRTEVNASFGASAHTLRDRTWKSLRVVDMLISNILGRPPSTSDVDCTVKYNVLDTVLNDTTNVLDGSIQIFMIIERVVVEVYSRKRISLRIANFVSRQLKGWASTWLKPLINITSRPAGVAQEAIVGACSTLCSYFYGIMLLTRPFLIYELYEYLGASMRAPGTRAENQEKRKFADAALEAASAFVEVLQTVINAGKMPLRMPLVVSWLFTTSLVLAVGVLGRSGASFKDSCQASICCLDHFGTVDPHARQYSVIVQALLKTTTQHVAKREEQLRSRRQEASSQLFGLFTAEGQASDSTSQLQIDVEQAEASHASHHSLSTAAPADWTIYDADFFALPWIDENDQGLQDFLQPGRHTLDGSLADIPLFPMYDQTAPPFGHPLGGT